MAEANQMAASEKAELFKKMREAVKLIEVDFQGKKPALDKLLRESQSKNDSILDLLKNRMRQLESEKAEIGKEVQGLKEEVKAALNKKSELGREVQSLKEEVKSALNEKTEAVKRSDAIIEEKEAAEEKVKNLLAEKAEMDKRFAEVDRKSVV